MNESCSHSGSANRLGCKESSMELRPEPILRWSYILNSGLRRVIESWVSTKCIGCMNVAGGTGPRTEVQVVVNHAIKNQVDLAWGEYLSSSLLATNGDSHLAEGAEHLDEKPPMQVRQEVRQKGNKYGNSHNLKLMLSTKLSLDTCHHRWQCPHDSQEFIRPKPLYYW